MRRILPFALLAVAACSSLTPEQRQQLGIYRENAAYYWESNQLNEAANMANKGLELDPDDYKLRSLLAWVDLRSGNQETQQPARRQKLYDAAEQKFAAVFDERSPTQHEPFLVTGYALCCQAQGMAMNTEAQRKRETADRLGEDRPETKTLLAEADNLDKNSQAQLRQSTQLFQILLDREELVMLAHFHMMQIELALGDQDAALKHAKSYFEEVDKAKTITTERIKSTPLPAYERVQRNELQRIQGQELDVRMLLAKLHRDNKRFKEAVEMLDVVLTADPSRTDAYYNRADNLGALGRIEESKRDFRTFYSLAGNLPNSDPRKIKALQALAQ